VFKAPVGEAYDTLREVLVKRGWAEFASRTHNPHEWNLCWRYPFTDGTKYKFCCKRLQRVNHYEKTSGICKKDSLTRNLRRMQNVYHRTYGFYPETYIFPRDLRRFETDFKARQKAGDPDNLWICKPADGSQGTDIYLLDSLDDLEYTGSTVVQKYLLKPYLIAGYKFDLRVYVLVESFRPLNVYLYREGLVRFSAEKYDLDDLDNPFAHLTNSSINKHSDTYNISKETVGKGCKWTLTKFFEHMRRKGADVERIWLRIQDLVLLTLLPIVHAVPAMPSCFELFGFDIILDNNLKPWLLEVNASPSISVKGSVDSKVKVPLLNDTLDVLGWDVHSYPPEEMKEQHVYNEAKAKQSRSSNIDSIIYADGGFRIADRRSRGRDYKKVKSKVQSRWQRSRPSSPQPRLLVRRWSSLGTSGHSRCAVPLQSTNDGVPVLSCNEPGWISERVGGYERICPFSEKTKLASQIIDPLGCRVSGSDSPFIQQQFDQMIVREIRERQKRFREAVKGNKGGDAATAAVNRNGRKNKSNRNLRFARLRKETKACRRSDAVDIYSPDNSPVGPPPSSIHSRPPVPRRQQGGVNRNKHNREGWTSPKSKNSSHGSSIITSDDDEESYRCRTRMMNKRGGAAGRDPFSRSSTISFRGGGGYVKKRPIITSKLVSRSSSSVNSRSTSQSSSRTHTTPSTPRVVTPASSNSSPRYQLNRKETDKVKSPKPSVIGAPRRNYYMSGGSACFSSTSF